MQPDWWLIDWNKKNDVQTQRGDISERGWQRKIIITINDSDNITNNIHDNYIIENNINDINNNNDDNDGIENNNNYNEDIKSNNSSNTTDF